MWKGRLIMCFRRSVVSLPEVQCMISEPKSVEESTYSASLSFSNPRVDLDLSTMSIGTQKPIVAEFDVEKLTSVFGRCQQSAEIYRLRYDVFPVEMNGLVCAPQYHLALSLCRMCTNSG
eukprot:scaffold5877_cov148-Skeletonema_menzelii.AAC.9